MIKRDSIHFIVPLTADKVPSDKARTGEGLYGVQGLGHTAYPENTHGGLVTASFLGVSMYKSFKVSHSLEIFLRRKQEQQSVNKILKKKKKNL